MERAGERRPADEQRPVEQPVPRRKPPEVEVFADVNCPFAYVTLTRLKGQRDMLGSPAVIRVRAWPLELVEARPWDAELVAREVAALQGSVAPDLFAGFPAHSGFPASSIPALNAAAADPSEAFAIAVRRALWEEGRAVTGSTEPSPVVLADYAEGKARDVLGSPHFFFPRGATVFSPVFDVAQAGSGFTITDRMAGFAALCARELA